MDETTPASPTTNETQETVSSPAPDLEIYLKPGTTPHMGENGAFQMSWGYRKLGAPHCTHCGAEVETIEARGYPVTTHVHGDVFCDGKLTRAEEAQ